MPNEVSARLSAAISAPELSRMWESERTTVTPGSGGGIGTSRLAPELVISARGNDVVLSFPSGPANGDHRKLKEAFERAVRRYRPDVNIDWAA